MRLVNLIFAIIELGLFVRLMFEFFGANTYAPFVAWLYASTDGLLAPFAGAFPVLTISGGYAVEFSILIAIIGYLVIGYIVNWILYSLFSATDRMWA